MDDRVADVHLAVHQNVVHGDVEFMGVGAQTGRKRALRVEVHEQHFAPRLGEGGTQVDGRRRLSHPALLVHHRNDAGRAVGRKNRRFGEFRQGAPCGAQYVLAGKCRCTLLVAHLSVHSFAANLYTTATL